VFPGWPSRTLYTQSTSKYHWTKGQSPPMMHARNSDPSNKATGNSIQCTDGSKSFFIRKGGDAALVSMPLVSLTCRMSNSWICVRGQLAGIRLKLFYSHPCTCRSNFDISLIDDSPAIVQSRYEAEPVIACGTTIEDARGALKIL
jgi:hypothetical protein